MKKLDRRGFIKCLGIGAAGVSLPILSAFADGVQKTTNFGKKKNVLFIAVDDLRVALGCYGDAIAKTPNMDKLADRGIVFNNAYCQQAICNPSRASVMTGLRPDTTKVWGLEAHFRDALPDVVTIPQYFKQNGYYCRSVGKIFHGTGRPAKDPASWSEKAELDGFPGFVSNYVLKKNKTGRKAAATECVECDDEAYRDGKIAKLACERMVDMAKMKEPFFLAVGFKKPHLPFCAPKKYWDLYDRRQFSLGDSSKGPDGAPKIAYHKWPELRGYSDIPRKGKLSEDKVAELRHGYYAATSYVDAQVGRVLDELDKRGLREDTVVVLWGDHGFHIGEHGLWGKLTNFEICVRSPLLLSVPGQKAGVETDGLVEFVDIYPTLVDACGLAMPEGLEGMSMIPLMKEPKRKWKKAAFSQYPRPVSYNFTKSKPKIMGYSIRTQRYRYTEWQRFKKGEVVARELYDYEVDEHEKVNLAEKSEMAGKVKEFGAILNAGWKAALPAKEGSR